MPKAFAMLIHAIALFRAAEARQLPLPQRMKAGGRCRIRTYDFHRVKVTLYR